MAGTIKLLQYQLVAYWRKSFARRGVYDKISIFLGLMILLAGYRFAILLNQTAKSLSEGKTGDLNLLLGIAFWAWILPAFESQKATAKLADFAFLPLTKNQFSLISLANIFLVPTSIIAIIISLSMIYPLIFSGKFLLTVISLFFYTLFAAFSLTLFVRLLKLRIFRILAFLSVISLAIFSPKFDFELPQNFFISNGLWLAILALTAFISAFLTIRKTISISSQTSRRISPQFIAKINLPVKFGELIKKDFLAFWKTFDSYISLLISIIYIIILFSGELSFFSFSLMISFLIMMCSGLAFNIFGLENTASFQRLSLLPIEPKDLFLAKNKAFAFLIFSQTSFLFPLIFYKFGAIYFFAAILKTAAITLFYMAFGNNLSVRFPFKMSFYEISFGGSFQDMLTAVFVISLINLVPDFFLIPNEVGILLADFVFVILGWFAYYFSLQRVSVKLPNEWENIGFKLS